MFKSDGWLGTRGAVLRVSFEGTIQLCVAQDERIAEGEKSRDAARSELYRSGGSRAQI